MIRINLPNNVLTVSTPYNERLLAVLRALVPVYGIGEQSVNKWQFRPEALIYVLEALKGLDEIILSDSAQQLKNMLENARNKTEQALIPCPSNLSYYPYQIEGVKLMAGQKRCLLADDTGVGKTIQIIGLINYLQPKNIGLIVPAIAKLNWERELKKWLVRPYSVFFANTTDPWPTTGIAITTIASLKMHGDFEQKKDAIGRRRNKAVLADTLPQSLDLLVLDEAHLLSNKQTRQSKFFFALAKRAKQVILLTGTPLRNKNYDAYPMLSFLWPDIFGNWRWYCQRFCGANFSLYGYVSTEDSTNTEELRSLMYQAGMIRRKKTDVLPDLPPKTWKITVLELDGVTQGYIRKEIALDNELRSLTGKIGGKSGVLAGDIARVRQSIGLKKVEAISESIKDAAINEKIIVYAHYRSVIDRLKEKLGDIATVLTGKMTDKQKDDAIYKFQNDPLCRVIVVSITAAGVAISLTASSYIIVLEIDWVPATIEQAIARADRPGQENERLLIEFVVFDKSYDAHMAETVAAKAENIGIVMN